MSKLNNQQGFAMGVALLLVVTVLAIGAAGYFTYHARTTSEQASKKPAPVTKTLDTKLTSNILKVKEFGFQLTLPSGLLDAEYTFSSQNSEKSALFSSKSLIAAAQGKPNTYNESDCTAKNGPIGVIMRSETDPAASSEPRPFTAATKQVGSFYLILNFVDGGPCSLDPEAQELQEAQKQLFEAAFKTAKPL